MDELLNFLLSSLPVCVFPTSEFLTFIYLFLGTLYLCFPVPLVNSVIPNSSLFLLEVWIPWILHIFILLSNFTVETMNLQI